MVSSIEATEHEYVRGYQLANLLDPTAPDYTIASNSIPIDLTDDILQQIAMIIAEIVKSYFHMSINVISTNSVTYGTSSTKFKNSNILFQCSIGESTEGTSAGFIVDIFNHMYDVADEAPPVAEFYLIIQQFLPANVPVDPYKAFGFAGGFLCDRDPAPATVIKLLQVISHVVVTPWMRVIAPGPFISFPLIV
ncbi:hypothetical protein H0H81_005214 [Sphagnurus paluster]|uniref:Uncharacterized protein n=1 Tax=Sphagnurus paluster TaxID=117069 RepID=A0A9P7GH88_9AGAR|nr:hypothetical protein H0H81_005214 [Sphagnurus paluster]